MIINLSRTDEITLYNIIDYNDIKLKEEIGKGASGTVYIAEYNRQKVAVKVSNRNTMSFSEEEFRFEVSRRQNGQSPVFFLRRLKENQFLF